MKKIVTIIALIICAALFASCGQENAIVYERPGDPLPIRGDGWTVLIYMMGGTAETEKGAASKKLDDIMNRDYPENVHVAVQTGGSAIWHKKGVYNDYLQRFEAKDHKLYLADQSISANMGDYRTLLDFLTWGISTYNTSNYMLIVSGIGGGGVYGIGNDELFKNDFLTLEELSYAIGLAGKNFDVVGLDASLMGSLEVASSLSVCADYLIAPQDAIDTDDFDYSGFLGYLCENPSATGEEIGKVICDNYYENTIESGNDKNAAMSVIDVSNVSAVNQALDGMAGHMLEATNSFPEYRNISYALSRAHIYGGASADEGYSDQIDLGDAAAMLRDFVGGTADLMIESINNTVVYRVCGENHSRGTGISLYYPFDREKSRCDEFMETPVGNNYKDFIRRSCIFNSNEEEEKTPGYMLSSAWNEYNNDMGWLEYQTILSGNTYELNIAGNMDLFRDVGINIYKLDTSSGNYVFIGKHHDFDGSWEGGIFRDNFDMTLPEFAGRNISINLIWSGDEFDMYSFPVALNGKKADIRVKYDHSYNKYEIMGIWRGLDENGFATASMRDILRSDNITPILEVYDENHAKTEYVMGASGKKLSFGIREKAIEDGEYIFEYEMTDMYGLKRWGTPVNVTISGKNIIFR